MESQYTAPVNQILNRSFPELPLPCPFFPVMALCFFSLAMACTLPFRNARGGGSMNNHACAACKFQRRRCSKDCPLAPYFPGDKPQIFKAVHRLFGVKNVLNILKATEDDRKEDAMRSIIYESLMREQFPVGGCQAYMRELLCQMAWLQNELCLAREKLEFCKRQARLQRHDILPVVAEEINPTSQVSKGLLNYYYPFVKTPHPSQPHLVATPSDETTGVCRLATPHQLEDDPADFYHGHPGAEAEPVPTTYELDDGCDYDSSGKSLLKGKQALKEY